MFGRATITLGIGHILVLFLLLFLLSVHLFLLCGFKYGHWYMLLLWTMWFNAVVYVLFSDCHCITLSFVCLHFRYLSVCLSVKKLLSFGNDIYVKNVCTRQILREIISLPSVADLL